MEEVLQVRNLTKKFGRVQVLNDVSFSIKQGEAAILLGPNGAGKTTIIKCILGLLNFKGTILVDGKDVRSDGWYARSKIGYLPQLSSFYETLTIKQHAELLGNLKGASKAEINEALNTAGLAKIQNRIVKALSSGMRQRLGLSIALLGDPPLLLLDEPTSNIDVEGQMEFKKLLQTMKDLGKSFLISTHSSGLDVFADKVIVLNKGKVLAEGESNVILNKIGAKDTVYIKLDENMLERAINLAQSMGFSYRMRDGWLSISLTSSEKGSFLESLYQSGIKMNDILVEQFSIEQGYTKLINQNEPA